MYVKFWGTRGSVPVSLPAAAIKQKIRRALEGAVGVDLSDPVALAHYLDRLPFTIQSTAGGNTTCLELRSGDQLLIIDAGSGLRLLGLDLLEKGFQQGQQADLLITHTHWDHIQGFPFFRPAFIPHNRFTLYSPFPDLEQRLIQQQEQPFFPVPVSYMSAKLEFVTIEENEWHQIGNFRVHPLRLSHPGTTYGYRIEDAESCLVLATDSEYKDVSPTSTEAYVHFFQGADLLIFDAQYNLTQALDRPDWGHSTAVMGGELAYRANVKRLALFHHDPVSSDEEIWQSKGQAEAYLMRRHSKCEVLVAYDGLSLGI